MNDEVDSDAAAVEWFVRLQACDDEAVWERHHAWLQADPVHAASYARVESLWIASEQFDTGRTDEGVIASSRPTAANDRGEAGDGLAYDPRASRRPRWWLPAGAAAAAAIAGIVLLPRIMMPSDAPAEVTYANGTSGIRTVLLADGSRLTLNRNTRITFAMTDVVRHAELLGGEAVFDISHQPRRPFTVSSAGRDIRVLGTEFDVQSRGGLFSVAVRRGIVSVAAPDTTGNPIRLVAGTMLTRRQGSKQDVVASADLDHAFGWTTGRLIYRDNSIDAVARDLSRYTGEEVTVAPELKAMRISGTINIDDPAGLDRQIEALFSLRIERGPRGSLLVRAK